MGRLFATDDRSTRNDATPDDRMSLAAARARTLRGGAAQKSCESLQSLPKRQEQLLRKSRHT